MTELVVEVVGGPGAGQRYTVSAPVEIGRADTCGIVLADSSVSGRHALLTPAANGLDVTDLGSTNGTWVNGVRLTGPVHLTNGWQFTVGTTTMRVVVGAPGPRLGSTINLAGVSPTISIGGAAVAVAPPTTGAVGQGDLTDELVGTAVWTDDLVGRAGIPIVDVPMVSVGGGIGSFVMADFLRIAGLPTSHLKVLTVLDYPWATYEYLTTVSQIPPAEILRSDSSSCPDNIWGFPAYAVRSVFDKKSRQPGSNALAPIWNVLTENVFVDYWTPPAGQAFRGMQKEADRIDYWSMVERGQVRMVRKRAGGGYFVVNTPPAGTTPTKRVAYRCTHVHLAVGYPGLRFLDDLQDYRQRTGDTHRLVNAYEPHEHVYEELNHRGGKVVVRGAGIVASRILQRLIDDRDRVGNNVQILQLFRTYVNGPQGSSIFSRRPGGHGWAHQGFNWPKAAWGGQYRVKLEKAEGEERANLLKEWGGTTTPSRKLWLKQLERGRNEGWYQEFVGEVTSFEAGANDTVTTVIRTKADDNLEVNANFVIDCTGLEADIAEHRILADLLERSGAGRNVMGRLDVERHFEVRGCANAPGKVYAVGSITLGGYYAGVDSFLGLQYASLRIADDLAAQGFVPKIGSARSIAQWTKWARNKAP